MQSKKGEVEISVIVQHSDINVVERSKLNYFREFKNLSRLHAFIWFAKVKYVQHEKLYTREHLLL